MSKIPQYILCKDAELARQVLEKIERESDLRWFKGGKPTQLPQGGGFLGDNRIIETSAGGYLIWSKLHEWTKDKSGNFTKAEDWLKTMSKGKIKKLNSKFGFSIPLDATINKIELNNNYMTEKTWDNLEDKDVLVRNGLELEVIGVCGRMVFTCICEHDDSDSCQWTKEELINNGWKIKGSSEDKFTISNIIEFLNNNKKFLKSSDDVETANKAIEMLKKLK